MSGERTDAAAADDATPEDDDTPGSTEPDRDELAARVTVLAEENRRLREEYVRARRSRYRRTALGLGAVGAVAALGGVAFPDARGVLFALAGTAAFVGVLVAYLTPERFVAATVVDGVYGALAENEAALVDALDLAGEVHYVPGRGPDDVRLFVPVHADGTPPDADELEGPFVLADAPGERGVAMAPSAARLVSEVRSALGGDLAEEPVRLADQLADAVVEQFELADDATPDVDPAGGRASLSVSGSVLGSVARFDHPVASLFAAGLAAGLDVPVRVDVEETAGRGDYLIACRWSADESADRS